MFTIAVVLFGFVSLSRLKVNLLPDLSYPTLTVRTGLTGAAPLEIENLLSKPIEEAVGVIKNVRQVRSVSRSGQSDVIIEFLWGTNMDLASVDVREKIDVLELPLEAKRPLLLRFDPSTEPIMRLALLQTAAEETTSSVTETPEEGLKRLRRFAEDELKIQLEAIEGTAAVKVSGGLEDEIQILVDQEKVAQLGLSVQLVSQRIRAENVNLSGGRLEQGSQRFLVRTINEFASVEEIANSIVTSVDERTVYLRDIATVTRGWKEREAVTRINGEESVELAIYKEGDGNTVLIASRIEASLSNIREKELPESFELVTVYDQSKFISSAINEVLFAALIGGILAILVLYCFLRDSRATVIIGLAIPVSVVGTFLMMYSTDLTLNIMSLGGIALAIGMLVDNSIVVLENIVRKKEQGLSILESARKGTSEVSMAVTAATLTTVAVFFPMVFVSGIAGQLFRDQALTVTFALIFSLLVALTLIPMLSSLGAAHRYRDSLDSSPPNRFTKIISFIMRFVFGIAYYFGVLLRIIVTPLVWVVQAFYKLMSRTYPAILAWSLAHRLAVVLIASAIFAASMTLVPRLGQELIPQLAQGEFNLELRLTPGSPLAETDRAVQIAQGAAAELDAVDLTFSVAGTGNRLDANPVDAGEHTGNLNVRLKSGAGREQENAAMTHMREQLQRVPGLQYKFSRPALFTFSTPLEVEIYGYDLDQLDSVNERIKAAMEASPRFADVKSSIETGNPEIQVVFDHERAARLGLLVRDIADRVVANVRGEIATRYTWRDKKIDVLVRSIDTRKSSVDEIRNLIVNPASDKPIPLSAVADISIARGPAEIRRIDQERVAVISANLNFGDLSAAVVEVQSIIDSTPRSAGIAPRVAGQSQEMEASLTSMKFTLALAIFLVYLVMASQFESLIHPFVILFTIPLALVGAVLALFITGTTINVVAFIGAIMLAGIVVNNAIVLVDLINQLRAQGVGRTEAIMEAGQARLRPILMTTLTTALGLLPMAVGFGDGAEVRAPMAITVIGGLVVSTFLTLVVIPVVYSLMDRKKWRAVDEAAVTA